MKKQIERIIYDTETATELGYTKNMDDREHDYYQIEILYKTPENNFFIWGSSGACGDFAKVVNGVSYLNTVIIPKTIEQAKKWVRENLTEEDFEEIFN